MNALAPRKVTVYDTELPNIQPPLQNKNLIKCGMAEVICRAVTSKDKEIYPSSQKRQGIIIFT